MKPVLLMQRPDMTDGSTATNKPVNLIAQVLAAWHIPFERKWLGDNPDPDDYCCAVLEGAAYSTTAWKAWANGTKSIPVMVCNSADGYHNQTGVTTGLQTPTTYASDNVVGTVQAESLNGSETIDVGAGECAGTMAWGGKVRIRHAGTDYDVFPTQATGGVLFGCATRYTTAGVVANVDFSVGDTITRLYHRAILQPTDKVVAIRYCRYAKWDGISDITTYLAYDKGDDELYPTVWKYNGGTSPVLWCGITEIAVQCFLKLLQIAEYPLSIPLVIDLDDVQRASENAGTLAYFEDLYDWLVAEDTYIITGINVGDAVAFAAMDTATKAFLQAHQDRFPMVPHDHQREYFHWDAVSTVATEALQDSATIVLADASAFGATGKVIDAAGNQITYTSKAGNTLTLAGGATHPAYPVGTKLQQYQTFTVNSIVHDVRTAAGKVTAFQANVDELRALGWTAARYDGCFGDYYFSSDKCSFPEGHKALGLLGIKQVRAAGTGDTANIIKSFGFNPGEHIIVQDDGTEHRVRYIGKLASFAYTDDIVTEYTAAQRTICYSTLAGRGRRVDFHGDNFEPGGKGTLQLEWMNAWVKWLYPIWRWQSLAEIDKQFDIDR